MIDVFSVSDEDETGRTWRLLPTGPEWIPGPILTTARRSHCTVAISSTTLVVTGGGDRNGAKLATAELVNYEDNTTTALPREMAEKRDEHGCALVETSVRSIVVAGGAGSVGLASVEKLVMAGDDIGQWNWVQLDSLPEPRYFTTLVPTNDNTGVAIFGGSRDDDKVYRLEPAEESTEWEEVPGVSFAGSVHTAATILAC